MSAQPYEIELVASETDTDYHEALLATITGLPKAEIREKLPEPLRQAKGWRGSSFGEVARLLGYNTTPRFVKWDPATPWPCILRVKVPEHWGWKGCWWALVYNQSEVYDVARNQSYSLEHWQRIYPACRVTSMLQIWISDL
ncbi:hypothetical protein [Hymenobacter metallilatus]|uniref:Uncharacterized protein n=1 Tax=Hymenobacter metallilatus TaxID=2493666 RepID=A0A428JCV1_9BACT|nr:hypothetical protein [Hymenobacter metallilatus]RSK29861.1 hypothetical protein EI290_16120 [Hymenobacter metallilatus]